MRFWKRKFLMPMLAGFVLFLGLPPPTFSEDPAAIIPSIVITEIGAFELSETEWIEIYNKSGTTTDLAGWKFFEDSTNHGLSAADGDLLLEPDEFAVIANKADLFVQKYPSFIGTVFDSSWSSLKEEGEEIGLKDASGNFVEHFTYPTTGSSTSLERIDLSVQPDQTANWTAHPTSHSLGQAYTPPVPAPEETETTTPEIVAPSDEEIPEPEPQIPAEPETAPPPPPAPSEPLPSPPIVTVANFPPQAVIQIQSGSLIGEGSTTVNFDGRASFDPNGDPLTFLWDMGDGRIETTSNPGPHAYGTPGVYRVTLTVSDRYGAQGRAEQIVQVLQKPTVAKAKNDASTSTLPVSTPNAGNNLPLPVTEISSLPTNGAIPQNAMQITAYILFDQPPPTSPQKKTSKKTSVKKSAISKKSAKTSKEQNAPPEEKLIASKNGDLSKDIRITELFPSPSSKESGEEWIELANFGRTPVNLGNWILSDASQKSPFRMPDTVTIQPKQYVVFSKIDTKIALNNTGDAVTLADFSGNVMDTVRYEKAKEDHSFGLVVITRNADSASPALAKVAAAASSQGEETWEWLKEPTPGKPNPSFEEISGKVARLVAGGSSSGVLEMVSKRGESKTVHFNASELDPLMAEVTLTPGTDVSLRAKPLENGSYELAKIQEVEPPSATEAEKKSPEKFAIFLIVVGILLNLVPVGLAVRHYVKTRAGKV